MKVIIIILISLIVNASPFFDSHDKLIYYPQAYGLKKLKCTVVIPNIKKSFAKFKILNEIGEIKTEVLWNDGKISVVFPDNFKNYIEFKKAITDLIKLRFDYLVPEKLSSSLKEFDISKVGSSYIAIDPKQTSQFSEISFYVDNIGLVDKSVAKTGVGSHITEYSYQREKLAKNKYILTHIKSKKYLGFYQSELESKIEYQKIESFYIAKKISSRLIEKGIVDSEEKKISVSEMIFSNCIANGG